MEELPGADYAPGEKRGRRLRESFSGRTRAPPGLYLRTDSGGATPSTAPPRSGRPGAGLLPGGAASEPKQEAGDGKEEQMKRRNSGHRTT